MPVGLLIAACCAVPAALAGAVLLSGIAGRVRGRHSDADAPEPDMREVEPR
ncbi:MAG: hypothetical protein O3C10_03780 [Chloroflexi bacterium]|nr:hypothetical protein [Chloroflexota bacterium]